jgi:hypothetical protein
MHLFFTNWTTSEVALANKSSDKHGASDAARESNLLHSLQMTECEIIRRETGGALLLHYSRGKIFTMASARKRK